MTSVLITLTDNLKQTNDVSIDAAQYNIENTNDVSIDAAQYIIKKWRQHCCRSLIN